MTHFHRGMLWLALVVVLAMTFFPSAFVALVGNGADEISLDSPVITFAIDGMDCEACAINLQASLRGVPGVTAASVYCESKTAQVNIENTSQSSVAMLKDAVEKSGFEATEVTK